MKISLEKISYEFDTFSVEIEKIEWVNTNSLQIRKEIYYEVKSYFTNDNVSCKFNTKKEALRFASGEIKHLKKCLK